MTDKAHDAVNHPVHYTSHKSGVECIQVTEHMGFNLGNAVKYLWRADLKADAVEDMRKAVWYIEREIAKRVQHDAAAAPCAPAAPVESWRPWAGGDCPVSPMVRVELRLASGGLPLARRAGSACWERKGLPSDIVSYRIVD
jgi:hypothetical protein